MNGLQGSSQSSCGLPPLMWTANCMLQTACRCTASPSSMSRIQNLLNCHQEPTLRFAQVSTRRCRRKQINKWERESAKEALVSHVHAWAIGKLARYVLEILIGFLPSWAARLVSQLQSRDLSTRIAKARDPCHTPLYHI